MPVTSALVGLALVGAILIPGVEAASAPPNAVATAAVAADGGSDGDEVHATYTRRFTVTNMSSKSLIAGLLGWPLSYKCLLSRFIPYLCAMRHGGSRRTSRNCQSYHAERDLAFGNIRAFCWRF